MCTGLEIAALLGSAALSAGGSYLQQRSANQQAQAAADARNQELARTLAKNREIAKQNQQQLHDRIAKSSETAVPEQQQQNEDTRNATLEAAVQPITPSTGGDAPISGSAPGIVKSELAKRLQVALDQGLSQAKSLGKLGAYGDTWFDQGVQTEGLNRNLGVNNNLAAGNMAILPYMQDFAEQKAIAANPVSPLGGIMSGIGGVLGGLGGKGTGKVYTSSLGGATDPWLGLRG